MTGLIIWTGIVAIVAVFIYALIDRMVHGDPLPHEGDPMIRWWQRRDK